jgi:fucose 4-O-acetylase-like acetyltransferase
MTTGNSMLQSSKDRIYYMDYLRAFIIFIVIVLHSLLPFVIGYDWIVNDQSKTYPFTLTCVIIDVFIMPIMFFIAGYFALPSIKKGISKFIKGKIIRILIPFFIGLIFFAPIMSYIGLLHRNTIEANYFEYWSSTYFKGFMEPKHFWFLFILFIFFMIFAGIYSIFWKKINKLYEANKIKPMGSIKAFLIISLLIVISIILFYQTGRKFPDGSWFGGYKFVVFQGTRMTGYVLYFTAGIIMSFGRFKLSDKFLKFTPIFILLTIGSTFYYNFFKFKIYWSPTGGFMYPKIQFYNAIVHVLYCFIITITLLMIFKKYLNHPSKILQRIADNSYTIYFVHMVFTVAIQLYTTNLETSLASKFIINLLGTTILSYISSELILKFIALSRESRYMEKSLTRKES